jgi:hypothetical protein
VFRYRERDYGYYGAGLIESVDWDVQTACDFLASLGLRRDLIEDGGVSKDAVVAFGDESSPIEAVESFPDTARMHRGLDDLFERPRRKRRVGGK